MIEISNDAALILFCDCLALLWLLILTEPDEGDDQDRNSTAWN